MCTRVGSRECSRKTLRLHLIHCFKLKWIFTRASDIDGYSSLEEVAGWLSVSYDQAKTQNKERMRERERNGEN